MTDEQKEQKTYKISVGKDCITVEASTKEECIELYKEATGIKREYPINEAIR
jgi:hypothetical protein